MSQQQRHVSTRVTVCELCNEIITPSTHAADTASLSRGYIANQVTEKTKSVWFRWPDLSRPGRTRTREQEQEAREKRVEWDFHAQCLYDALKTAIENPSQPIKNSEVKSPEDITRITLLEQYGLDGDEYPTAEEAMQKVLDVADDQTAHDLVDIMRTAIETDRAQCQEGR